MTEQRPGYGCDHRFPPGEWCPACGDVPDWEDDLTPADCPGGAIDDLCTWPDVESCGLCTLGAVSVAPGADQQETT